MGIWDVDGMMDQMPSALLSEWIAFSSWEHKQYEKEREKAKRQPRARRR